MTLDEETAYWARCQRKTEWRSIAVYCLGVQAGIKIAKDRLETPSQMRQTKTEKHLERMMREANDPDNTMNIAGLYYLAHLVREDQARFNLCFNAMVMDYAKRHGLTVKSPIEELNK
jgi:hypothetical protein